MSDFVYPIHICMSKTDFKCPHCGKQYDDENEIYLNRCNKNKIGCVKKKCDCGNKFFIAYNYMGDIESFK